MNAPIIDKGNPNATSFKAVLCLPGFLMEGRNALIMLVLQAVRDGKRPPMITVSMPVEAPTIRCCRGIEEKEKLNEKPSEKG
jgi:hypothetical protein